MPAALLFRYALLAEDVGAELVARGYEVRWLTPQTVSAADLMRACDEVRPDQRDIVTLRVFDILACGGVALSERSHDLATLFDDGHHLATYRGIRELAQRTVELARDPERRAELAAAGRAHVDAHHRLSQRVDLILAALR